MDMDATLRGYPLSEQAIQVALMDICDIQLEDNVILVLDYIIPIRADDEYGGFRAAIIANYESISTPLKVDITTGDVITPGAIQYTFHSSFENKIIEVWAYNIETILAEKVETILRRSVLNTRPRDFYDVYIITKTMQQDINKEILRTAFYATCEKRMSLAAFQDHKKILLALRSDAIMNQRWDGYSRENYYANGIAYDEIIGALTDIINIVQL